VGEISLGSGVSTCPVLYINQQSPREGFSCPYAKMTSCRPCLLPSVARSRREDALGLYLRAVSQRPRPQRDRKQKVGKGSTHVARDKDRQRADVKKDAHL
jgi:hypothetical protein